MVRVVSVHSFRGGTGKSNITANVAVQLAQHALHVGVIDTDIQSPGIHVLFGLDGAAIDASLNDHLFRGRPMAEVAVDVTPDGVSGGIHLIPSSVQPGEISRVLREGYDAQQLVHGVRTLVDALGLDVLLIDTHPGLGEETLLSLVISDTSLMVLRPDQQDYEGTGVLVDVAANLDVPRSALVVNKVPASLDVDGVRRRVEQAYGSPVAGVLAHDDAMMLLASGGIFALRHPDHPLTSALGQVSAYVMDGPG
ncbi:MAG TPA: MinD/ParA family protein [Euzebyales bacterium]|nr:MinD/ParA family protein [Euzebyales bacterium]